MLSTSSLWLTNLKRRLLSDTYEDIRRLSDAYGPRRRLSNTYDQNFKKKI